MIRTLVKNVLVPQLTYSFPFIPDSTALQVQTIKEAVEEKKTRTRTIKQVAQERRKARTTRHSARRKAKPRIGAHVHVQNNTNRTTTTTSTTTITTTPQHTQNTTVDNDELERKYDEPDKEKIDEMEQERREETEKEIEEERDEEKKEEKEEEKKEEKEGDERRKEREKKAKPRIGGSGTKRTKNLILRPLRNRMGLPHYVHHASVFIENRLLDVSSLLSASKAALANRWLTTEGADSNLAVSMFRDHLANYSSLSPTHPCCVIVESIKQVPSLLFLCADQTQFLEVPRKQIRETVWKHQYEQWQTTLNPHKQPYTLPPLYAKNTINMTTLPQHMHLDNPRTASRRSRLRLDRAKLNASMVRLGYKGMSSLCECNMSTSETVTHVLAECPCYVEQRRALESS